MDINRLAEVLEEVVKRLDQAENKTNKLDHLVERLDTLLNYIEDVKERLEMLDQKTDFINTNIFETREVEIKHGRKLQGEIEQVKTSITSLVVDLNTVEKCMATVVQKINSVETSLTDGHKIVKEDLISLKQGQNLVTTKIEESTNEVKNKIYRSKREILAVTEKEAQIVRDRIEGPLPSLGKYSFDFYVEDFKTLVRSGKGVHNLPWHINEAKTSVAGYVHFLGDGTFNVWCVYGRQPREVGLRPRPARDFKVKATICDVNKKLLPDIVLGEATWNMDETDISHNGARGWSLGVTSCDDLIKKGYGQREGYWWGAILVRYDVTVL